MSCAKRRFWPVSFILLVFLHMYIWYHVGKWSTNPHRIFEPLSDGSKQDSITGQHYARGESSENPSQGC